MDRATPVDLAPGEPSEQFFIHFNALLSQSQVSGQGSGNFLPDGAFVSACVGLFTIAGVERPVEWRVTTTAGGGISSILTSCADADATAVNAFVEEVVRSALANALSKKRQQFLHRRLASYVGPALSGEFWLPGFRFAPAVPDDVEPFRMDFERIVVLDFTVMAIDQNESAVLASKIMAAHLYRLALILQLNISTAPLEWVWVLPNPEGDLRQHSERRVRRFFHPIAHISSMPEKGQVCHQGVFKGSIADPIPRTGVDLISVPTESRALLQLATRAPLAEALAIDACARMYSLSLVMDRHSQSAALAYRVAAIDAIVTAMKPTFTSVSDFVRRYCTGLGPNDPVLDFIYGAVRSGHFHAGSVPLDGNPQIPFHPLMEPTFYRQAVESHRAQTITRTAIGGWLKEIAARDAFRSTGAVGL